MTTKPRTGLRVHLELSAQLLRQHVNQLQPQRVQLVDLQILRQSHTVVADGQLDVPVRSCEPNLNPPRLASGNAYFRAFETSSLTIDTRVPPVRLSGAPDRSGSLRQLGQLRICRIAPGKKQGCAVVAEVDVGKVVGAVQSLMDEPHGADAVLAFPKRASRFLVVYRPRLQAEKAGDDLKACLTR